MSSIRPRPTSGRLSRRAPPTPPTGTRGAMRWRRSPASVCAAPAGVCAQSGRSAEALSALDAYSAREGDLEADTLFTLGERLVHARLFAPSIKAYTLGLRKNPYHREALYNLATAYVAIRDTANAVATARRLLAVDPLNRAAIRVMAQAWDAAGRRDSAQKYQAQADSLP